MLRTLLIATTLLSASGAAMAHGSDYGRVVSVEPHFSISFGTRHHDGFRVLYESGGDHYRTYTPYRPSHTIVLPPRHQVRHVYNYRDSGYRDYGRDWDKRHKGNKHRNDWDDGSRDKRRDHRRHGRD